jgi:hypothetical protein
MPCSEGLYYVYLLQYVLHNHVAIMLSCCLFCFRCAA